MANEAAPPSPSFEQAFEALRKAVQELESGPLPLDVAIARYEDGIRLAQSVTIFWTRPSCGSLRCSANLLEMRNPLPLDGG